ncbi:MAG: hypothetical protein Q7I96_11105 [Methanobacteriaceae archaeon]|nr:hypothetical protein [Methanobacteriaceae archaeon]
MIYLNNDMLVLVYNSSPNIECSRRSEQKILYISSYSIVYSRKDKQVEQ